MVRIVDYVPDIHLFKDVARGHVAISRIDVAYKKEGVRVYFVAFAHFFYRFFSKTKTQAQAQHYAHQVRIGFQKFCHLHFGREERSDFFFCNHDYSAVKL